MKFVDFMKNNLNKLVSPLKSYVFFSMSIYFKYHIKLLKFITQNPLGYLMYIFFVAYGTYGGKTPGFETSKLVALFIASYLLNTAVLFYILSKISFIFQFLENLLTREFMHNHLGLDITSKILIRLFLPLPGLFALEIFSHKYSLAQAINVVSDMFFTNYGSNGVDWSEEVKKKYISTMLEVILDHKYGVVNRTMNGELIRSLVSIIHNIVENIIKIIFKK